MTEQPLRLIIVGGVAGGASAATRARRCNEQAEIILIDKSPYVSFANCGMPYYLGGEIVDREALLVAKPELFRKRFRIDVRTRHEVIGIDRAGKLVKLHDIENDHVSELTYDKLILATGAHPIRPPLEGLDAENVFTIHALQETDRLKAYLQEHKPKSAVVVGAGFIGLEMVEQLQKSGVQVAVAELQPQVLPPLDAEMASIIQQELQEHGVELHLGDGISSIQTSGSKATGVVLNSGREVTAELVLLNIGVRPNSHLAKEADLELGRTGAVLVNQHLQSSDPDIYAVGDLCEYPHGVLDASLPVPLAGPANKAGRLAGQHAVIGHAPPMPDVMGTAVVRVFGKSAAMTGLGMKGAARFEKQARSTVVYGGHHAGYYPGSEVMALKLIYNPETAHVLGAQAVGGEGVDKRIDVVATTLKFRGTVFDLAGLDLAYAPQFGSAKDPLHQVAFIACNQLDGLVGIIDVDADLSGYQVLDVRTETEVSQGAMPDFIHIPIDHLRERIDELDKEKPVVTVCRSGQRAYLAARILLQSGFSDVSVFSGGMLMYNQFASQVKAKE